jgi:hypothetical protein
MFFEQRFEQGFRSSERGFFQGLNGRPEINQAMIGSHVQQAQRTGDAQAHFLRHAKPDAFIHQQQIGAQVFGKCNRFGLAGIQTEDFRQAGASWTSSHAGGDAIQLRTARGVRGSDNSFFIAIGTTVFSNRRGNRSMQPIRIR